MVGDMFKEFLEKLYPWHFHVAGAIILAALALFFWYTFIGVNKFTRAVSSILEHHDHARKLQEELEQVKVDGSKHKMIADHVSRVIFNLKPFIDSLNEIRTMTQAYQRMIESSSLIQRVLDSLTSDMKTKSGEHHRCGIWMIEDDLLRLAVVSAGFPSSHRGNRTLSKDRSIAGRAFRTKQTQNIADVTNDTEWVRNDETRNHYLSLICVPLGDWGVLTIDGIEPMSLEGQHIGELYASVIQGAIQEYYMATSAYQSQLDLESEEDAG